MQRIWKEYFGNFYYTDTQEQVSVLMGGFDVVRGSKYFGEEPIRRTEVEVREGKLN